MIINILITKIHPHVKLIVCEKDLHLVQVVLKK